MSGSETCVRNHSLVSSQLLLRYRPFLDQMCNLRVKLPGSLGQFFQVSQKQDPFLNAGISTDQLRLSAANLIVSVVQLMFFRIDLIALLTLDRSVYNWWPEL